MEQSMAALKTNKAMPSSRRVQLQGPRPPALTVSKDSHQIKKQATHNPPQAPITRQTPAILYVHTPKIIHATPQDFMSLVQRLTGKSKNASTSPSDQSCDITSGSSPEVDEVGGSCKVDCKTLETERMRGVGDGGDRDPLLLTLGQSPTVALAPSPLSPGFFLCSPGTSACLQDIGFLF